MSLEKAFEVIEEPTSKRLQFTAFTILTLGWVIMGYSRFVLGVHGANQIIYGAMLGLLTCPFCIQIIGPWV